MGAIKQVRRMQFITAGAVLLCVLSLQHFFRTSEYIWLIVSIIALGSAVRYFAESIMILYNPISLFAAWAKWFATGMGFQMAGAIAAFIAVFARPQAVSDLARDNSLWVDFGPSLFLVLATILTMTVSNAITSRILGYNAEPSFGSLFVFPATILIGYKFFPALTARQPFKSWLSEEFWNPLLGADVKWPLFVAGLISVSLASLEKQRIEFAYTKGGKLHRPDTVFWLAAPIAMPLLAMLIGGYALIWTGLRGGWPFVAFVTVISLVLCRFPFRWILRWLIIVSNLRAQRRAENAENL